ncbi:hypothetical protein HZB94_05180 [Candidatus Falkowbacteria bacterium]|nr:hypothetical protein [Candidatus Falkowbacteria bacterium]
MGGGGTHYDRDTTDIRRRTHVGTTTDSEAFFRGQTRADESLLPKNRHFRCEAKSPVVLAFDVTGSMGNLPKIIWDKMPMIAGQIAERNYLTDPMFSVAAIGDFDGDSGPIQISNFVRPQELDAWLKKIWLEKGGGGSYQESYEVTAYAYTLADLPNAEEPFCIITGDEGFRETEFLGAGFLKNVFGNEHQKMNATAVFQQLLEKFKGNVFLVHRRYQSSEDSEIVRQWQSALGEHRVVLLPEDLAVADIILGIFALMTGSRTLEEYATDMRNREQTEERIREVTKSLEVILPLVPDKKKAAAAPASAPADKPRKKARVKKPKASAPESPDDDDWKL